MDYWEWIDFGIENEWISMPVCYTHDTPPMTEEEYDEFDMDLDPCIPIVRLWGHEKVFDVE